MYMIMSVPPNTPEKAAKRVPPLIKNKIAVPRRLRDTREA
jgi:hypothetical protein